MSCAKWLTFPIYLVQKGGPKQNAKYISPCRTKHVDWGLYLVILLHVAGCQLVSQLLHLHLRWAAFQEDIPPNDLWGNRVISHQAHWAQVGVLGGIFGLRPLESYSFAFSNGNKGQEQIEMDNMRNVWNYHKDKLGEEFLI